MAHNEVLYPSHKWFLKVLENVKEKPVELMTYINSLLKAPTKENVSALYHCIKDYRDWEKSDIGWPSMFMLDIELTWMNGSTPVSDIHVMSVFKGALPTYRRKSKER